MSERIENGVNRQQKIQDIFRQTYFISQGKPRLQILLFRWLGVSEIVTKEESKSISSEWLAKFASPRAHHPLGYLGSGAQKNDPWKQMLNFQSELTQEIINPNRKHYQLISNIFDSLVEIDFLYQILERPNRNTSENTNSDSMQDSHKSYIRHYVVFDNYNSEPFNQLFVSFKKILLQNLYLDPNISRVKIPETSNLERSEVREEIEKWVSGLKINTKLELLKNLWEQNHPGEKFFK